MSVWSTFFLVLALTHMTIISVTVYLHRAMSHRSVDIAKPAAHVFRFWLWLTTGMNTKEWVAVHRKHHAMNETDQDPHSPKFHGLWRVLIMGAWLYHKETNNPQTMEKYGYGCPNDWIERNVYKPYPSLGIFLMLALDVLVLGWSGLVVWTVQMLWIPFTAAGVINGIGHAWGYRNFEVDDRSRNILPWGILIGGEELHNNHHAYPTSAKLSYQWYEFDLCYGYIVLMSWFGLAKIRKVMPSRHQEFMPIKDAKQFLRHRLFILKKYSKMVMFPILREQKKLLKTKIRFMSYRKVLRLMMAPSRNLTLKELDLVSWISDLQDNIKKSYDLYNRLYNIFFENSREDKVKSVVKWCNEAKKVGIEALSDFADNLQQQVMGLGDTRG